MGTAKGNYGRKMYSDKAWKKALSEANTLKEITIEKDCPKCGEKFAILRKIKKDGTHSTNKKEKKFCSIKCANSGRKAVWTNEAREKASAKTKQCWKNSEYAKKQFDRKQFYTSKREIEIRDYFKKYFPLDGWNHGRIGIEDEMPINGDLFSHKLKILFEYDGIWHFKDIHGQLKNKQKVDAALEKWATKNKYRIIRIDEEQNVSIDNIIDLIYNRTEPIIKIGDRYKL